MHKLQYTYNDTINIIRLMLESHITSDNRIVNSVKACDFNNMKPIELQLYITRTYLSLNKYKEIIIENIHSRQISKTISMERFLQTIIDCRDFTYTLYREALRVQGTLFEYPIIINMRRQYEFNK